MAADPPTRPSEEESDGATPPLDAPEQFDLGGDETLRWTVSDDGEWTVERVEQRYGAFSELDPVDVGEATNAAEDHDEIAWGH
jgi:hypothetical protein